VLMRTHATTKVEISEDKTRVAKSPFKDVELNTFVNALTLTALICYDIYTHLKDY